MTGTFFKKKKVFSHTFFFGEKGDILKYAASWSLCFLLCISIWPVFSQSGESKSPSLFYVLALKYEENYFLFKKMFLNYYYYFLLYNVVLVLSYINMHPPHVYTCFPSWTPLLPPSPDHPSGSSQCTSPKLPVSCIEPGLAIHFLYDIIHVLMPFSQIIPHLPSPTELIRLFYTSVFLSLSRIQCYRYHLSKFHIYVLVYCISVFLSGLLHSV